MRVITGKARGMKLSALEGEDVRPTTDMVKESIFSIIQFSVPGAQVLDLFAGSGQLGIEALSRDAAFCTFVDKNRDSYELVKANLAHCKLTELARVENSDSLNFLKLTPQKFDIALLDPPYRQGLIDKAMPLLDRVMNPGAVVVCEHEREFLAAGEYGSLKLRKRYRYGKIMLSVYDKSGLEE
ncbi:16S rRNA (guanine(966)-N(2))-methyltransferase RsmD [Ruminococcaceae bacterium FB2012]|nr:16S rRNA (guanine(966)-N(2))-methyltransferase RsmD [Ruminococcaceae bacterium FB2012]